MFTLKQMRDDLRFRLNQNSSESNLVWEDSELDTYIRDGVYFILDHGRFDLIHKSFTTILLTQSGTGFYNKPDNLSRFVAVDIDNVRVQVLSELGEYRFIEGNDKLKGNTDRKYIYDYGFNIYQVSPDTAVAVVLHYMKQPETTDFDSDNDVSQLTNVGDRYAIQYSHGLVLESKLFKPDEAERLFNRVDKDIK
ncbi:MAG: phage adaptor protein [Candidatus Anammoxibacter sp.]